jgi:oxalate decarboxylase/phosphoglucose isomerase-like protein (cupin superfamily)
MTVFASAGDISYIPKAMTHDVQNLGDEPLRYLPMFRSSTSG